MQKKLNFAMLFCAALLAGSMAAGSDARADSASRTWVGPNGGTVHWRGDGVPGRYRGAVTVTTPDGRVYRRVTNVRRGPNGVYYGRRWVGPNGAYYRRGWVHD